MFPLLIGLILGLTLGYLWSRHRHRPSTHIEFWVFSADDRPITSAELKTKISGLPGEIWHQAGIDPWTFTDVRWRMGDGDRKSMVHAFNPTVTGIDAEGAALVGDTHRITKIIFAGPIGIEGVPIATVSAAVLALARELGSLYIWDAVARRGWTPRAMADTAKQFGIDSAQVHLSEERTEGDGFAELLYRGYAKRGKTDFESLPYPEDMSLIAEQAFAEYAGARWRGEKEFAFEAYGDIFRIRERVLRKGPAQARLFREQR